jgi:hypothetical protein
MHKEAQLRLWVVVIAGLGAAVALLVPLLAWAHLPEPMATHWSLRGTPNGSMPRALALALFGGCIIVPAALSLPQLGKPMGAQGPRLLGALAFMSSLLSLLSIINVAANWDRAHWSQAAPLSPVTLLGSLAAAFVVQRLVAKSARSQGLDTEPRAEQQAALGLAEGERVFWAGRAQNATIALMSLLLMVLAAVFGAKGLWGTAATHVVVALLLEHFTCIRVTVSAQRLTIFYGHLGLVRQRVQLSQIRHASTFELVPMAHRGWGYRGSLTLLRRAHVVVRRGAALRLDLEGDRQLSITVDDAPAGAELLNGLAERAKLGAGRGGPPESGSELPRQTPASLAYNAPRSVKSR